MSAFLISAAQRYMDEIKVATLPHVRSPYLTEDFTLKGSESPGLQAPTASSHKVAVRCETLSPGSPCRHHEARFKSELLATLP